MAFSVFEPWLGLLVGIAVIAALCGPQVFGSDQAETQ